MWRRFVRTLLSRKSSLLGIQIGKLWCFLVVRLDSERLSVNRKE